MKAWTCITILWLAATVAAIAQPRNGPPSITQVYGPNPSSPPNLFQNAPQMTAVPGPDQGNVTVSPQRLPIGNSAPPAASPGTAGTAPASANGTLAPDTSASAAAALELGSGNTTAKPVIPTVLRNRPNNGNSELQNVVMPTTMGAIDNQRRLHVNDQIVYQVEEDRQPPRVLFVDESGNISVPYGPEKFPAADLTLRELAQNVSAALTSETGQYHKATVLIEFFRGASRGQVFFVGEVVQPGPVEVPRDKALTLYSALGQVGGFTQLADVERILIVRYDQNDPTKELQRETVDYKQLTAEGKFNSVVLQPGDFINIPSRGDTNGSVFVTGEVGGSNKMLSVPIPAGRKLTLTQAITQAGGWTDWSSKTITLIRTNKDGKEERTSIDVEKITDGDSKDVDLQPGDHVIVKMKWASFGF